ncbi:MAG: hypothetical protein MAG795_00543 [Candidatus Woesearchaeota archaeon]|nr:hypothetical protein [Candidatus Woesearchaeota archaeon]
MFLWVKMSIANIALAALALMSPDPYIKRNAIVGGILAATLFAGAACGPAPTSSLQNISATATSGVTSSDLEFATVNQSSSSDTEVAIASGAIQGLVQEDGYNFVYTGINNNPCLCPKKLINLYGGDVEKGIIDRALESLCRATPNHNATYPWLNNYAGHRRRFIDKNMLDGCIPPGGEWTPYMMHHVPLEGPISLSQVDWNQLIVCASDQHTEQYANMHRWNPAKSRYVGGAAQLDTLCQEYRTGQQTAEQLELEGVGWQLTDNISEQELRQIPGMDQILDGGGIYLPDSNLIVNPGTMHAFEPATGKMEQIFAGEGNYGNIIGLNGEVYHAYNQAGELLVKLATWDAPVVKHTVGNTIFCASNECVAASQFYEGSTEAARAYLVEDQGMSSKLFDNSIKYAGNAENIHLFPIVINIETVPSLSYFELQLPIAEFVPAFP